MEGISKHGFHPIQKDGEKEEAPTGKDPPHKQITSQQIHLHLRYQGNPMEWVSIRTSDPISAFFPVFKPISLALWLRKQVGRFAVLECSLLEK
ncbi:hypothetical protein AVEN_116545-1 [Araneus ventricosus]|uniref:Uncharacterized protein n=1 Tax=Araneus ventricosus TaxID=182803 RepID=A0A4Y2KMB5_ARAVE|nr:hypothetical protein AVEN_116545-1 [Araneus ventricosus]